MLTLMIVSSLFSVIVYNMLTFELLRGFHIQELRVIPRPRQATDSSESKEPINAVFLRTAPLFNFRLMLNPQGIRITDPELFEEAKHRIAMQLLSLNAGILALSGLFSFFLAGKTLRPIETSMEEQNRFIADASHELRTPLTSMKTEVEVALRDKKLKLVDAKELLKSNLSEIDKMKYFSDNLLSLSRYDSNGRGLPMEDVDLAEAARQAIERNMPQAKDKRIKVKEDLSQVVVKGNPQSLVELISILINNAIKYSPEKSKVSVRVKSKKKHANIEVDDKGVGIDEKDISHIFDRFYRADTSRSKIKADGYGLGLSIAKSIVDVHKGEIKVESQIGKGSTFMVKLPL